jgi:hypothetical protein
LNTPSIVYLAISPLIMPPATSMQVALTASLLTTHAIVSAISSVR